MAEEGFPALPAPALLAGATCEADPAADPAESAFLKRWDHDVRLLARRVAYSIGGAHADENDVAQEVRVRLLRAWRSNMPLADAYIRRIIRNTALTALRDLRPAEPLRFPNVREVDDKIANTLSALEDGIDPELKARIESWVPTLPAQMRLLVSTLYVRDLTQREVARLLGLSQPRVAQLHRDLLARGRQHLQHVV